MSLPEINPPILPAGYRFKEVESISEGFPDHDQDMSLLLLDSNGQAAAACSLWWTHTPAFPSEIPGIVGHFQSINAECGAVLLQYALAHLQKRKCTIVIGPMDGNTWRRYRLVTEKGDRPPFLMEPANPDDWPTAFTEAGFTPLARYYSAVVTDLTLTDKRIPSLKKRLTDAGVTIRPINMKNFAADLERVHTLSLDSFRNNFLYTELALEDFLAQYTPVQSHISPDYVLLAEHEGRTVGFVFAIPDLAQAQRGQAVDTIILKTLAVAPGRSYAGLGALLLEQVHQTARAQGFTQVIHALMHEGNSSMNLSAHSAIPFRGYTLYSRKLT